MIVPNSVFTIIKIPWKECPIRNDSSVDVNYLELDAKDAKIKGDWVSITVNNDDND